MAVGDSTVVLQSINRMFDRLSAEKRERRQEALQMMQIGLQERKLSMMEEVRNLQMQQSKMQMAAFVVGDMEKQTNVQKAKVANSFLLESRFLDFYNPDDSEWAVKFREVLKGEYKEGYFGEEQGYNFSDKNASLISNALLQAQGSQDPQGILDLIDKANRAYLTVEGKGKISAEDANLLRGFTHMGMLNIGEDEKGDQVFEMSPTWQSLATSTDNIFQNEAKIARERVGIQSGDYEITEKLSVLEYEDLPDINQSLNEVELQQLMNTQMQKTYDEMGKDPSLTQAESDVSSAESSIDETSDRLLTSRSRLATKQTQYSDLLRQKEEQGFGGLEADLQILSNDIATIKDSIRANQSQLTLYERDRIESMEKLDLEQRGVDPTPENIEILRKIKQAEEEGRTELRESMTVEGLSKMATDWFMQRNQTPR